MANLAPIPIPGGEKWHALRMRLLPLIIFAATAIFIAHLWRDTLVPPTFTGQVEFIESKVASAESGTLARLNIPSRREITELTRKVEELSRQIDAFRDRSRQRGARA